MPVATILIGLPGSGKSTLLKNQREYHSDECFDDFHGSSMDGTSAFAQSRHYRTLHEKLRSGRDCILSDIEYCRQERMLLAEEGLRALSNEIGAPIEIVHIYFENNPSACRHNVVHRLSPRYIEELHKIDQLTSDYKCPPDKALPVICCCRRSP